MAEADERAGETANAAEVEAAGTTLTRMNEEHEGALRLVAEKSETERRSLQVAHAAALASLQEAHATEMAGHDAAWRCMC